jgi:Nitrile hydratase beta subunit, N-terminal
MTSTLFIDVTVGIRHGADPDHLTVIDGLSRIEEKRRGVEALGAEMISKLTYYERWIAAFANILVQKATLTPEELARKRHEVSARRPGGGVPGRKAPWQGLTTILSNFGPKSTTDQRLLQY